MEKKRFWLDIECYDNKMQTQQIQTIMTKVHASCKQTDKIQFVTEADFYYSHNFSVIFLINLSTFT